MKLQHLKDVGKFGLKYLVIFKTDKFLTFFTFQTYLCATK